MGRMSRFLLGVMLVEAPLVLGSNRAVFWSLNALLAATALLFFVLSEWKSLKRGVGDWRYGQVLLLLLALPALWMTLQIVPGVPPLLAHPAWLNLTDSWATISINPRQTALAIMWWLTLGICFIALRAGTRRGGSRQYLYLMMSVVLFVAIYGLANLYFDWRTVGVAEKTAYAGWLTGTFVNRNSAASFFDIGIAIATTFGLDAYSKMRDRLHGTSTGVRIFLVLSSQVSIFIAIAVVLFVATLQTGSRAGLACMLVTLLAVFFLSQKEKRKTSLVFPIGLIVALALIAIGSNALLDRARDGAGSSWARINLTQEALAATLDRPLLGHGGGAYQTVEPLYHLLETSNAAVWNRAHNSYAEAAATMGLPVLLLWLGLSGWLLWSLYKLQRQSDKLIPATVVLLAVVLGEGLHAIVDFSLQMQAVAIYVACLLGLAIGEVMAAQTQSN
jgi:O-antigen ligase